MSPDLVRVLQDPAAKMPPEAIARLLGELEQVKAALWARLLRAQVNGEGAPGAPADDRLLTIAETAERLGVPKSYAYELARRGELPTVRIGVKYLRVSLAAFQRWLAERQELDTAAPAPHSRRRRG